MKLTLSGRILRMFCSRKMFFTLLVSLLMVLTSQAPVAAMKIAFQSSRGFGNINFNNFADNKFDIYVMDADGTNRVRLTKGPASNSGPTWSPDGKRIAFTSNPNGVYDIYVMNADGTNLINLTRSPTGDFGADWSPDGKQIVYGSNRNGNEEIYVINVNGTNPTNLSRH